jgi:hypothetical protein
MGAMDGASEVFEKAMLVLRFANKHFGERGCSL